MGQIVSSAAKPKRCNLNQLSQVPTPAAGEHILVSSDNSMNAVGQGNFDCYIEGDGQKAATALELKKIEDLTEWFEETQKTFDSSYATIERSVLKWDGTIATFNNFYTSGKISVKNASKIVATGLYYSASTYMGFALYDDNDVVLYRNEAASIDVSLDKFPTASYMRFCRSTQSVNILITFLPYIGTVTSKSVEKNDDMPVSGGAVYSDVLTKIEEVENTYAASINNTVIKVDGTTKSQNNYSSSALIEVSASNRLYASGLYSVVDNHYRGLYFYDASRQPASMQPPIGATYIDLSEYQDVAYIRFCGMTTDNPQVTIKDGYDLVGKVREMSENLGDLPMLFSTSNLVMGIDSQEARTNNLSYSQPIGTTPNSAATSDGVLTKIVINASKAGKCHFGIGVLDQSLIPVILREFDVNLPVNGYNSIDISEQRIPIHIGEQIFFMYNSESDVRIKYSLSTNASDSEYNCPYGTSSGLDYYGVQGTYLLFTLAYEVLTVESIFALQQQVELLEEKVSSLEGSSFVYDTSGNPYKLRVVNGDVIALPQQFSEVLVLGNSLTWHEYNTGIGWYGRDRSMASTTNEVSWPYLLQRILRKKNPTALVRGVMMRNWERAGDGNRDINNITSTKELLDAAITSTTDLIIFRCGENGKVTDADVFKQEILDLIDYCLGIAQSATVVVCGLFWPNATKDSAILAAANARGYTYITAGRGFSGYQEINGDFMVDSDDGIEKKIGSACLSHTADHGFYLWANHVAKNIGYSADVLDELYVINVSSTLTNGYKIKDTESPYNSLVTILVSESTAPTISVTDSAGNTVNTSVHTLENVNGYTFAFTFIQPNSDVNVVLSE